MAGGVLVVLTVVLGLESPLRDVLIAVGSFMIGLIALRIAELAPERGARALQDRVERDAAYYLGYAVANLSLLPWPIDAYMQLVELSLIELDVRFSDSEQEIVTSASSQGDANEVGTLASMLLTKSRTHLPSSLWSFFTFGVEATRLYQQMDQWSSTRQALAQIEHLQTNPFIRMDSRYASAVDELAKVLRAASASVTVEQRPALKEKVLRALEKIPSDTLDARNMTVPLPVTAWFWVTEGAVRFVGDDYTVLARSPHSYEIADKTNGTERRIAVTRDQAGWHCAIHPAADEQNPCAELDMVLNLTNRGQPVTEARLIPVRSDDGGAGPPATVA
jgi:hypothetical protein